MTTRAFLLDIEGTTTPISFVHDVLFPYAREHFKSYLEQHFSDVADDLARLREERDEDVRVNHEPPPLAEPYIYWLMDRDRKSPALKSLQGKIWEYGYHDGSLIATVFDDVPHAFERWLAKGQSVNIFSSGSILAQQLLFKHTNAGDLSNYISQYFDTGVGKKTERASYERISAQLDLSCADISFVSDTLAELDAAADAGMTTMLCVRTDNRREGINWRHSMIGSLEEI